MSNLNELVPTDNPYLTLKNLENTDLGTFDWETLVSAGMEARNLKDYSQWILGKLAMGVEVKFGLDSLGKYASSIGVKRETLKNYRWVYKQWRAEFERPESKVLPNHTSFTVYQVLASREDKVEWLQKAVDNDWSVEVLGRNLKKATGKEYQVEVDTMAKTLECPRCGYTIVLEDKNLADPFEKEKEYWVKDHRVPKPS